MFRALLLLSVSALSTALPVLPHLDGRIVGGTATVIEKHPFQVSLQRRGRHFCGGSLITSDIVLTAAHCVVDIRNPSTGFTVRLGSSERGVGGVVVPMKAVKFHERYNPTNMQNDIAIIRLAEKVAPTGSISTIQLAETAPVDGTRAVVTGWGTLWQNGPSPLRLQEVQVNILSTKTCTSEAWGYGGNVFESMICAHGVSKDACQGDSGGPLVANSTLVGVVSWGYGCAIEGYPGVYADVANLYSWIVKSITYLN